MAKNKASVQSLFQEEFAVQRPKETASLVRPEPERPEEKKKAKPPVKKKEEKPEAEKEAPEKEVSEKKITETEPVKPEPVETKKKPEPVRRPKEADSKRDYRPSSIYLSGENVNFVKYITKETRVSQKQYINELLLEKQESIERENPLTEGKKILDFKQPVRGKYRSFKENSTIYSISVPKDLTDYFDRVCERDHITFSTLVDNLLTEKREAFLKEQEEK